MLTRSLLSRATLTRSLLSQSLLLGRSGVSTTAPARATITMTALASAGSSTDGTSVTTASISPAANKVLYAGVLSGTTAVVHPTCTGNGLTWVEVASVGLPTTPVRRLTVFRAMGASPSAGAVTFDWGAESQTSFRWVIVQVTNADTSGTNGSGATVQSNTQADSSPSTSFTATLTGALENAANAMLVFQATDNNAITADATFTSLGAGITSANSIAINAEWALNKTSCTSTYTSSNGGAISIEVKAATA